MPDLSIAGAAAGQPVSDAASVAPFAGVTVATTASTTPYATATVALSSAANGALSHLGVGTLSADGATYTVSGSPALVQAALRGLVFTPVVHEVVVGQSVTTGFALTVSDAAGAVTDARTSVAAAAADTPPTITDTSAVQLPRSFGSDSPDGSANATNFSFAPFAFATIADPDAGASETTTITLMRSGVATDAVGLLSGAGLTKTGIGTYTLAAASPAAETAALEALRFSPTGLPTDVSGTPSTTGTHLDVTLSVSDGFGTPVSAPSSIGLPGNPGGGTVIANSVERPITYDDTPVAQTTHAYATTIEAVLNGTVLYERGFDLPYSDAQVQAAVGQAQAAVRAAGGTPGSPQQTASNFTTLNSQTSTLQTGAADGVVGVVTSTNTFGPNFVGPNTSVATPTASESDRGHLYILPGQLLIDINTVIPTTVSRTVTTISTDLLSQQYVITGTAAAMPNTTLVSSNAAGVEGNRSSTMAGFASSPAVSADGSHVLFSSDATNLVAGDVNGRTDLFVKNLATGGVVLADTTAAGVQGNAFVSAGAISGDATRIAFSSQATNLDSRATDFAPHLYLKDLSSGALTLIAPADYVIRNASTGAVEAATNFVNLAGASISPDGRYLLTQGNSGHGSNASALVFDTATHTALDLSGLTGSGGFAEVSADSSTVVFTTNNALVAADTDGANDVYAYSFADGSLQLVDTLLGVNTADVKANGDSLFASVSRDGSRVAFQSTATNLDYRDTDATSDIYVKDLVLGRLVLADTTAAGVKANADASQASISPDGRHVVFLSTATNLAPGATDGAYHVYVKDLDSGALTLLDVAPGGAVGNAGAVEANFAADGAHIVFQSDATNLVANDTNAASDVFIVPLPTSAPAPTNTPPTITGVPATEADPGRATFQPFGTALVTGQETGQTFTVSLEADRHGTQQAGGTFAGGGFTAAGPGGATFSSTSLAALQAALRAVSFTPNSTDTDVIYNISSNTGSSPAGHLEITSNLPSPANTPPTIGDTIVQYGTAGVGIAPFSQVTVTDPDAGQNETVIVSFTAADGTLSGGGFVQTAPGVYSVIAPAGGSGASAAAAQADLRAAVFTPTAGQSAITNFSLSVNDGQYNATDSISRVIATYTAPTTGGGGGVVTTTTTPPSVQSGLVVEFQNLERALANGVDANTPGTPVAAAFAAYKAVAAQLDNGQVSLAQAEASLAHLVDGTTAVPVAAYGFFTGSTPTAAGLNYLVHSSANATDLNDAYYARFSTENRYINFAVNLATGPGAGAAAFQANYGALSLADATTKAYAAVFGAAADAAKVSALLDTLVPDGLGGQETRAQYFAQYGGDGPNGQGTKAAMVGFLLSNAVHDGSGVYGAATEHYLAAIAHGTAPVTGSEIALTYGPNVSLVGVTPVADPTVGG